VIGELQPVACPERLHRYLPDFVTVLAGAVAIIYDLGKPGNPLTMETS